jgi:hypothetical protein
MVSSFVTAILPSYVSADNSSHSSASVRYVTGFVSDPGMVVYYPLLEGRGSMALDVSGSGNNGMLYPNGSWEWLPQGGLHFVGANNTGDRVVLGASTGLQSANKTVVVKFMWDSKSTDSEMYLYDDGWSSNSSMTMYVHPSTSRVYVEFNTAEGVQNNLWYSIVAGTVYTAIFSFDGYSCRFWLNNQVKSFTFSGLETLQTKQGLVVGSDYAQKRRWFSGDLYAFEVLNRSISSFEAPSIFGRFSGASSIRANPLSEYVVCGWVDSLGGSVFSGPVEPVEVRLNQTAVVSSDVFGVFRFVFDLPKEVGNFTYVVSSADGLSAVSTFVVVDRVLVVDSGSTDVAPGSEAVAWFRLASEFDGAPVESSVVSLTGGLNATWNAVGSRWEYREFRSGGGSLSLRVESVVWDKYGVSALSSSSAISHEVTMTWTVPDWYVVLLPWIKGIGPAVFGVIILVIFLIVLLRFKIIRVTNEQSPTSAEILRKDLLRLIDSSGLEVRDAIVLKHVLNKLLDESSSQEILDFLRESYSALIKGFERTS